jgi:predicted Rossmann-fold nucleotide-binding protein
VLAHAEPADLHLVVPQHPTRTAPEVGGKVIGLPMSGWSDLIPSRWNRELRWSRNYPEPVAHLLAAEAVVALDGGIGTMSGAAVVWAARQTEPSAADLIFLGGGWQPVLHARCCFMS